MATGQRCLQQPRRLFSSSAVTAEDGLSPWIVAIVCLPDDRLLMTDWNNDAVKVMELSPPHAVSASLANICEKPWRLAVLPDGLVAMTTMKAVIYLLTVTDTVAVSSRVETVKPYAGIVGLGDGHLLASCLSSAGMAAVDMLTRQGDLVRRIVDSSSLATLDYPYYLCNAGDDGHVLLSEWKANEVSQVCVSSGQVTQVLHHAHMKGPRQLCLDSVGRLYVASEHGQCVVMKDTEDQWTQVLTAAEHSDPGFTDPWGLCLTRSGHLVVTWGKPDYRGETDCVVICYRLT